MAAAKRSAFTSLRSEMHKKVWIAAGDNILVGHRNYVPLYQDDKADAILMYMYMYEEAALLEAYGKLPDNIHLNEGVVDGKNAAAKDGYIQFEDKDIEKI